MSKEQHKRQTRNQRDRVGHEKDPMRKEIDRQVSSVRENAIDLDGNRTMRQPLPLSGTSKPPGDHHAAPTGWVQDGLDGKANSGHGHGIPDNTGYALNNTSNEHRHSISSQTFIQRTAGERERMLDEREELMWLVNSDELSSNEEVLARNTLNLLSLLMDYRDLDAFERERRFKDPAWAEWTEDYKRAYGVDEYGESARLQFQRHGSVRLDPYTGIARTDDQL